jgi:hypothetical protein
MPEVDIPIGLFKTSSWKNFNINKKKNPASIRCFQPRIRTEASLIGKRVFPYSGELPRAVVGRDGRYAVNRVYFYE